MTDGSDSFVSGTESDSFPAFSAGRIVERPDSSRIFVFASLRKQIACNNSCWKSWVVCDHTRSPSPERRAEAGKQSKTGQKQGAYSLSSELRESAK
tara:strand:- start:1026 stop:1313 length:288 start_codon:yes stop_codon:yes gene_type:complete